MTASSTGGTTRRSRKEPSSEGDPVGDLYDYQTWATETRGWRKLKAAVNGGAAVFSEEGRRTRPAASTWSRWSRRPGPSRRRRTC
ncbi:hypothetical protein V2I01_32445 [Micromonospora sp. BRA006-A]|nr:hypothetical protein [Micromonospora sp. BRA006-A]